MAFQKNVKLMAGDFLTYVAQKQVFHLCGYQ